MAGSLPPRRVRCVALGEPSMQGGLQRSKVNPEEKESTSQVWG